MVKEPKIDWDPKSKTLHIHLPNSFIEIVPHDLGKLKGTFRDTIYIHGKQKIKEVTCKRQSKGLTVCEIPYKKRRK